MSSSFVFYSKIMLFIVYGKFNHLDNIPFVSVLSNSFVVVQIQSSFAMYCSQILGFIFNNPFIQANPIALIFLISVISQILFPVPKSEFFIPIITNGGDASAVIIASTAGNIISEIILYY